MSSRTVRTYSLRTVAVLTMRVPWLFLAVASGTSTPSPRLRQDRTSFYVLGNSVNGGLVGAIGPSLPGIGQASGLGQAALGRLVLINRVSKMVGTLCWTQYARHLQQCKAAGTEPLVLPETVLAACMATAATCALAIASARSSSLVLHVALVLAGATYGLTDSGMTLLTMWALPKPTAQRAAVAGLNAGFTVGALLTPVVVAWSMWAGRSCYLCFYALSALATAAAVAVWVTADHEASMAAVPAAPKIARAGVARARAHTERTRRVPLRPRLVTGSMAFVLFCVTGAEHAVGTWLATFSHAAGVALPTGALMTSVFWTTSALRMNPRSRAHSWRPWPQVEAAPKATGIPAIRTPPRQCHATATPPPRRRHATATCEPPVPQCATDSLSGLHSPLLAVCAGRVIWAALAHLAPSGWLVLASDASIMLLSSLAFIAAGAVRAAPGLSAASDAASAAPTALLWAGTVLLAAGFASSIPCAYTVPAEVEVESTPGRVLTLNAGGSLGEMVTPFVLGLAFEHGLYSSFGATLLLLNAAVLVAVVLTRSAI